MKSRRFFLIILSTIFFAYSTVVAASEPVSPYLSELIQKARVLGLAKDPYWRILLHYRHTLFSHAKSEIKSTGFFNSNSGRTDPEAELEETLRAFFSPIPSDPTVQPAQCLFIDRYQWLKDQLHFDPARLPEAECHDFNAWKKVLDPSSVTLVFSSYFMSNPSSSFGHTLLRLNHRGTEDHLLDYGVNYAANPTTTNAFLYGVMGLVGGFDGVFSNIPYFMKVTEYSDIESRDLWEYDLNFTQSQVDRMMLHLWTLGHFSTPYYFFNQNCSYMMLTILDAGNPDLKLGDEFDQISVIPADTVRGVTSRPGFVKGVEVRPSLAYRVKKQLRELSANERALFFGFTHPETAQSDEAWNSIQKLPEESQRKILDLCLDYFRYLVPKNKGHLPASYEKLQTEVLDARVNIADASPEISFSPREIELLRPDIGHKSARFTLGGGYQNQNGSLTELGFRPAFQDLNANTQGYSRGVQIDLLDTNLNYSPRTEHVSLERFDFAQVISLEPYDPLFKKFSWSIRVGADPIRDISCGDCVEYKLNGGMGYSFEVLSPLLVYGLLKADLGFGPNTTPRYRLGPASELGALLTISDKISVYANFLYHHPLLGFLNSYSNESAEMRFSTSQNTDLRFSFDSYPVVKEEKILLNVYF